MARYFTVKSNNNAIDFFSGSLLVNTLPNQKEGCTKNDWNELNLTYKAMTCSSLESPSCYKGQTIFLNFIMLGFIT